MQNQKQLHRNHFKALRFSLSTEEVQRRSILICKNFIINLLNNLENNKTKSFALYFSAFNEVDTKTLKEYFLANKFDFAYGKIDDNSKIIKFIKYRDNQLLEPNLKYKKIIEPVNGEEIIPDYIITPLVAFDQNLNRLGMGKGYYDRTISHLKSKNSKIKTIGLAYEFQALDSILSIEKHDISLDIIVCEKNIFFHN